MRIAALYALGLSPEAIAQQVDRTVRAVAGRLWLLRKRGLVGPARAGCHGGPRP